MTTNAMVEIPEIQLDKNGHLIITASPNSSKNDFDFLVGDWLIRHKKLKHRLVNNQEWIEFDSTFKMFKVLNGLGNIDNMNTSIDGAEYEGMSIRFFNPTTQLWSIHWADTNTLALDTPTVGSFDRDFGHFFTTDHLDGKKITVVYRWDVRDKENPIWSQAFSADQGQTWEWNWYMYFSKINQ
jgi:hypothetical protein